MAPMEWINAWLLVMYIFVPYPTIHNTFTQPISRFAMTMGTSQKISDSLFRNLHLLYDMNSLGTEGVPNWQTCFSVVANMPSPAFFGVSAATGDITDYHDVVSVVTYA